MESIWLKESNDLTELKDVAETEDPRAHLQNNYVNVAVGMFGNQEGRGRMMRNCKSPLCGTVLSEPASVKASS